MDLINMKVSHKIFGDGIIIAKKNSYITVKFCNDEKKFIYPPNAFDGYLTTEDTDINNKIKGEIEAIKRLEDEKKQEMARKEKENLKKRLPQKMRK